jgi:putative peptidoglycan lipid II flippase
MRSAGVIALGTLCSRILGFVRDLVIARLFGVYTYAQAFVVALRIPNLFRDLVAEGATNAALVPVFSEYRASRTPKEFWELANTVLNLMLVIVSALVLVGVAVAPFAVRVIAPGFAADAHKLATTVMLTRIIFPYLLLISLAAYCMALLNSMRHFAVPAFAPCLLNVAIIACAFVWGEGIRGLAAGVLIGGVLQLAVQVPLLYARGFRVRLFRSFRHPAAAQIGRLMVPRLASSGIYQLNNFVDSIFGSLAVFTGEGGVAILYFAYRLIQFPLGLFSTALSQAVLPVISTQALAHDRHQLRATVLFALRVTIACMVPATAGFIVLAHPLVRALFAGGRFDAYAVGMTARVLMLYSIGLSAWGCMRILQFCCFALKDTITPAKVAAMTLGLNILFNTALIMPLGIAGVGLASSLSGIISCAVLAVVVVRSIGGIDARALLRCALQSCAAALVMAVVLWVCVQYWPLPQSNAPGRIAVLGAYCVLATGVYVMLCACVGLDEVRRFGGLLLRGKRFL